MGDQEEVALDPVLPLPDSPEGPAMGDEPKPAEPGKEPEAEPGKGEPAKEEPAKEEDKGKEAPARSEAFEKLLAKYGGDYDKLANSIFEQYNSAARTHEEIVELRGLLEELRASKTTAEEAEKAVAEDPYVQEVNADLTSLNEEATTITAEMKGMVTEYQKQVAKVAKLEGALSKADDNERYEISQDLREAQRDLRQMERDYKDKGREYKRLESQWKTLQRNLRDATAQARSRVDSAKQNADRLRQETQLTRQEYRESLRKEATEYGIDPSSKEYSFIDGAFKARLATHMRALQAQGYTEGIDIPRAVSILMKEYAESKKFSKTSTEKDKVATPRREAQPAVEGQGGKKEGEMTAAQWKARARQLMP